MERLTKRLPDGKAVMDCDSCEQKKDKQCTFYECRASLIKRLAAYEDTGLTPAEVHSMYSEWNAMMSVLNSIGSYDRLRELAEADKDGRVVVLPCKVGDTIYFAHAHSILWYKVTGYEMGKASISQVHSKHVDKETGLTFNFTFRPGSIGKTVFFTREEAERAMEGRP